MTSPRDSTGRAIHVGDIVRVIGTPDLGGMTGAPRRETARIFRYLLGKYKRVAEFDDFGHVGLWFRIRGGRDAGIHWVSIEPWLLRVKRRRGS